MRRTSQPGFAMLLVMILVAVGVILGMSYLSVASLKTRMSTNFQSLSRARYLAESGLEHAVYLLRFSPEQLEDTDGSPLGPFYVDDSSDQYVISAIEDGAVQGKYTLRATAVVGDVTRTSSMTVCRTAGPQAQLDHGMLVGGGIVALPWSLDLVGDFHANGFLLNAASIDGDATTTSGLWDPFGRITGSTDGSADEVEMPDIDIDQYKKYTLSGTKYKAERFKDSDLTSNDPLANGGAITSDNPAGVVHLKPKHGSTVTLHDNLNFTGTLIIDGNIELDGRNITLTPVAGFPAIVATGTVKVTNDARNVTIEGLVSADYGIVPGSWNTGSSSTTINGALVSKYSGYSVALSGNHTLNYNEEQARFLDMSAPDNQGTAQVTALVWND